MSWRITNSCHNFQRTCAESVTEPAWEKSYPEGKLLYQTLAYIATLRVLAVDDQVPVSSSSGNMTGSSSSSQAATTGDSCAGWGEFREHLGRVCANTPDYIILDRNDNINYLVGELKAPLQLGVDMTPKYVHVFETKEQRQNRIEELAAKRVDIQEMNSRCVLPCL